MSINLRQDAPSQSDIINPEELSVEIEKLQSIHKNLEQKEKEMKELKEDEKIQSGNYNSSDHGTNEFKHIKT